MEPYNEPFQPEHVDEQIEWLALHTQEGEQEQSQSAHLVQSLQKYYVRKKQADTLKQAWEHISQRYEDSALVSSGEERIQNEQRKPERSGQRRMQQRLIEVAPGRKSFSGWGVIAAVIVTVLLIGSMAVIMSQAALQKGTPGTGGQPSTICSTATPTAASKTTSCVTPTVAPTKTNMPATTPTVAPTKTNMPATTPTVAPLP